MCTPCGSPSFVTPAVHESLERHCAVCVLNNLPPLVVPCGLHPLSCHPGWLAVSLLTTNRGQLVCPGGLNMCGHLFGVVCPGLLNITCGYIGVLWCYEVRMESKLLPLAHVHVSTPQSQRLKSLRCQRANHQHVSPQLPRMGLTHQQQRGAVPVLSQLAPPMNTRQTCQQTAPQAGALQYCGLRWTLP